MRRLDKDQRTRADTATAQAVDGDRTGQEAVPPQKCDSRAGLWPAQRVARCQALPAQGSQPRSVRMAPAGHRVQSQEPPRGVQVWGQPSVALWGRSAAPTGALPDRRTPPSPTPSPSLSPFCSYHPPSDYVPHPTHHAPYQYNETASLMGGVCWSALAIHRTFTYPCRPVKGEGVMQRSLTYMGGQAFRGNHQGLAKAT